MSEGIVYIHFCTVKNVFYDDPSFDLWFLPRSQVTVTTLAFARIPPSRSSSRRLLPAGGPIAIQSSSPRNPLHFDRIEGRGVPQVLLNNHIRHLQDTRIIPDILTR